jgi:hypothetical protein
MRRMPTTCHHASFIDTLPLTNQRGLRSVGNFVRLAIIQWQQVATGGNRCQQVSTGVNKCQQVSTSVNRCQQVSTGVNRCLLVAVRSHFGLRLERRINPD